MDLKIQVLNVARFPKEEPVCKFPLSSSWKEAWKLRASQWKKSSPGALASALGIPYCLEVETLSPSECVGSVRKAAGTEVGPEDTGFNRVK